MLATGMVLTSLAVIVALVTLPCSLAKAQQASQNPPDAEGASAGENNGQDLTRPENLFQLRFVYQTAPGSGSTSNAIRKVSTENEILRMDTRLDLGAQWVMAFRGDLPFVEKNPVSGDNPTGEYLHGIGDADVQATIAYHFDARWAAGAGSASLRLPEKIISPAASGRPNRWLARGIRCRN